MEAGTLSAYLKQIAFTGQEAHAYILEGEKEVVFEVAEKFARELITSPADLLIPEHEKPNLFSVEDVRETINKTVHIRPYGSGKKVYIVKDAEKMNVQAQNALLKTIEEPPEYVVILLLTDNAESFLETIRSRCVRFNVYSDKHEYTEEEKEAIALVRALFENGPAPEAEKIRDTAEALGKYKGQLETCLEHIRLWLRDALVFKAGATEERMILKEDRSISRIFARERSFEGINRIMESLDEGKNYLKANVTPELTMEMIFFKIQEET